MANIKNKEFKKGYKFATFAAANFFDELIKLFPEAQEKYKKYMVDMMGKYLQTQDDEHKR